MQKTIRLSCLFLVLLVGSFQSFAQNESAISVSLLRWQANSPVQVVGTSFGEDALIDEIFLFNSSSSTVNRIKIAGVVLAPEKHLSKDINDFMVLESASVEVSIPPLKVVQLKKASLWSFSVLSQFRKTLKSTNLILRLGISQSVLENGVVYETNLKEQSFDRAEKEEVEYKRIDDLWQKHGYKQLLDYTGQAGKDLPAQPCNNNSSFFGGQDCRKNNFDYDTSWCQRTSQTTCRTLQCNTTQSCPKDSCVPTGMLEER